MVKLPKSLTQVTGFSKTLALLLILVFLLTAFYGGMLFQRNFAQLATSITPTPTPVITVPVVSDKTACTIDGDCTFATQDTKLSCCPGTRCMRYADNSVSAVSAKWLESEKLTVCGGQLHMCPMIAIMCARSTVEENSHYVAKCVQHVCTKTQI